MMYRLLGNWQAWSRASCTSISVTSQFNISTVAEAKRETNLDRVIGLIGSAEFERKWVATHLVVTGHLVVFKFKWYVRLWSVSP